MAIRITVLIVIGLSISSCLLIDTSCCNYVGSYSLSNGLYVEKYRTFCAGVYGELIDCYITDSINFRTKIGSYDEHEGFYVNQQGDKIVTYNFQSFSTPDTIDRKNITRTELWKQHHSDKNCLNINPIFGKNTIKCSNDFYPASSYKTEDCYYMTEVQFKCGNDYSNAVFYTDSLHFCVFIGIYIPGSPSNMYSVKMNNDSTFDFYNIEYKNKVDTVKSKTFLLTELYKRKLTTVCK